VEHIHEFYVKNTELFNFKSGGTYKNHCALNACPSHVHTRYKQLKILGQNISSPMQTHTHTPW